MERAAVPGMIREQRLNQWIEDYSDSILRTCFLYLSDQTQAEDATQDTWIKAWKYMDDPARKTVANEKAWLLRVAINLSKNKIKYNKIRETDELMEGLVSEEKEELSFVWEAVKSLPEKYASVVHLYYQEGGSNADIAGILNKKESTVRSDLKRARDKLKKILKEEYDFG